MKVIYIGRFPPPYGGVTIKNKLLYDDLVQHVDKIEKIDLGLIKSFNFREIVRLFISLLTPSSTFIIGSASTSRKFFSILLYYINRKALNRSLLIVMGGISSRIIAHDPKYLKWVEEYKQIYVETEGMKCELTNSGIKNVSLFPNCRERPKEVIRINNNDNSKLKCLFFSQISKSKGADIALETANILSERGLNYSIDFYGHVEDEYKSEFKKKIGLSECVNYCGVFRSENESVYEKLQQYDLLLFPTRWKAEGVPGVLVEAKIAGLPAIVSNINYNSEIVDDGKTGFVLNHNTPYLLASAIEKLNLDRELLTEMKCNAKVSSERYLTENYISNIVRMIKLK